MRTRGGIVAVIFCFLMIYSCSSDYSPKPTGYPRLELPGHEYVPFDLFPEFQFDISTIAYIDTLDQEWFNIVYPQFNARLYCSLVSYPKNNLRAMSEEMQGFIYLHTQRSEAIEEISFENIEKEVYGTVYLLKGSMPSPIQFVITDSIESLFRGALYFQSKINQDSIAPVVEYINKDIEILFESFTWK